MAGKNLSRQIVLSSSRLSISWKLRYFIYLLISKSILNQDDADLANRAIPELIRLLSESDAHTVQQAASIVNQLTKKEASCHVVLNNIHMVSALVRTATNSNDAETVRSAVGAMHNMSHHR